MLLNPKPKSIHYFVTIFVCHQLNVSNNRFRCLMECLDYRLHYLFFPSVPLGRGQDKNVGSQFGKAGECTTTDRGNGRRTRCKSTGRIYNICYRCRPVNIRICQVSMEVMLDMRLVIDSTFEAVLLDVWIFSSEKSAKNT